MAALNSYSTGTISVAAGGTTVTGVGTIWSGVNARPGDILQIGNLITVIIDVPTTNTLTIPPWGGAAQAGAAYTIWQWFPQRVAGALAMADVSTLVAALNTDGFYFFVPSIATAPDPSYGNDGQFAFQATTGKMWLKEGGVWVFIGVNRGFVLRGAYSSTATYNLNDVVSYNGLAYAWISATPGNQAPPNATYWMVVSAKGDPGTAATIAVGTVTTGAPGTPATVTNVGTSTAAIFNFQIPQGPTGAGTGNMLGSNNLSELTNKATARANLAVVGVIRMKTFMTSGTYTPDPNLIFALIECYGGGGGGGGVAGDVSSIMVGGGGASSGYAMAFEPASAIGASQIVTIGAAGAGAAAGANDGGTGGTTSFGNMVASGGGYGGGGVSLTARGNGGNGSDLTVSVGSPRFIGAIGGPSFYMRFASTTSIVAPFGYGANTQFGNGALGRTTALSGAGANGNSGSGYGSGGGGAVANQIAGNYSGGPGRQGICMITEFCSS